jgi:protein SCO1/2
LYDEEEEKGENLSAHTLSLIIGNQSTGQWRRGSPFENPYILATQIGGWLHNWKMPPQEKRDYADAPKVRNISEGERLFRTRCTACHSIGAEDASGTRPRRVGPDLLNVTRNRDRAWVTRFIAEPDKMIEEKDPLAVALLAEYNNLPMPNLRLNNAEVQALLTYIEEESNRVEHQRQEPGGKHHHHGAHQP